jgi:hypothetical protein
MAELLAPPIPSFEREIALVRFSLPLYRRIFPFSLLRDAPIIHIHSFLPPPGFPIGLANNLIETVLIRCLLPDGAGSRSFLVESVRFEFRLGARPAIPTN